MKSLTFLFLIFIQFSYAQQFISFTVSDTPVVFGPGVVSDGFSNRDFALSPDGKDFYYTIQWGYGQFSFILHSKKIKGGWTKPSTAEFSGRFNDLEPAFSPDGNRLYFTSNRPIQGADTAKDYDIWYLQNKAGVWEGPFNAGPLINSEKDEFYPSVSKNGNLYFTRDNGENKDDIFVSAYQNGKPDSAVQLSSAVNSKGYDFNSFVDPDEKFILFSSYKRADDLGGGDLYYSLKKNGEWQPAVHFGKDINSTSLDYSPFISSDRRYFFFTSKRQRVIFPFAMAKSAEEIKTILNSYGNGNDDIYFVDFKTIESIMNPDKRP